MSSTRRSVLVTGASRGIGRAAAERFAADGWEVFAGVRKAEDAPAGTTAVLVDVTDPAQIASLPEALPASLDLLVNNAGVVVAAPVEGLPIDELRRQLEINVVGQIAVTQAVMPALRAARGRVLFVSSTSGRVSTPMTGAYNASKFAIEALADSMRVEVRSAGIEVVLIEPGATRTDIWNEMDDTIGDISSVLSPELREHYAKHLKGMARTVKLLGKGTMPVEGVVKVIVKAAEAKRPRARYIPGVVNQLQVASSRVTPAPVLDAILGLGTGMPRRRR